MHQWMKSSEDLFKKELGDVSVGFRPPAGVQTPELHWQRKNMGLPIILWEHRFLTRSSPGHREKR